ncbi:hypothetical protein BH09BAC5_BH09BAC5_09940 [soil metagenome]
MKKIFLLSAFSLLFAFSTSAQTDKGWRSVGGSGLIKMDFKNSTYNFGLSPELYWFVANNFELGFDFGFGFGSSKYNDSTSSSGITGYVAPGIRYYFSDTEHKWRPYAFLNGGYEFNAYHNKTNNIKTNGNASGFRGYAGMGLAWFFNEHAAFDMRLHLIDYGLDNSLSPPKSDVMFNPTFTIGIRAFFHHD